MQGYGAAFGLGLVAGMRSMSACAALTWAAADGRTRGAFIPAGAGARALATTAALAVGDALAMTAAHELHPNVASAFARNHPGGAIGVAAAAAAGTSADAIDMDSGSGAGSSGSESAAASTLGGREGIDDSEEASPNLWVPR